MNEFKYSQLFSPKACACYFETYLWGHIISGRPWTWFSAVEMFLIPWSCTLAEMAFKELEGNEE